MDLRNTFNNDELIELEVTYLQELEERAIENYLEYQDNNEIVKLQRETIKIQKKYIQQLELSLLSN